MERIGEDRVQRVARYTKTRVPLELPVTRQLGDILARRRPWGDAVPEKLRGWVFPAPGSVSGHVEELQRHYEAIGRAGGGEVLVSQRIADRIDELTLW